MKFHELLEELGRLKLETGQTMSEYAVVLTVISGTSVFLFTGLSAQVATAVINVVRLLP
jgi:Flp pilus assembly pilin Flp